MLNNGRHDQLTWYICWTWQTALKKSRPFQMLPFNNDKIKMKGVWFLSPLTCLWHFEILCSYVTCLSFFGKISDFSGFRPDNLTPRFFGRICPAAQSGRTLITPSSKKLWPSALQWFHRGSLAFFQVCTSSLRTTPTNVNNFNSPNEWNTHSLFPGGESAQDFFPACFLRKKGAHFEHHFGKDAKCLHFLWEVPSFIFRVFRLGGR